MPCIVSKAFILLICKTCQTSTKKGKIYFFLVEMVDICNKW